MCQIFADRAGCPWRRRILATTLPCPKVQLDRQAWKFDAYSGLGVSPMVVEVQQAEKRATRRFALRLPVSVNYSGNTGPVLSAQTRDVSARGICFYLEAPRATGSSI